MKARERHDLKKNDLADTLEHLRDFLETHGSKVLAVVLVIVVIGAAGFYLVRSRNAARLQAWDQLHTLKTGGRDFSTQAEDLRRLAKHTSDPKVSALAWKELGDTLSLEYLVADKSEKNADLIVQAEQAYQTVIDQYSDNTLAVGGARMGLAIAYETTGRWDQAKDLYEQISADPAVAGTGISQLAAQRLSQLDTWKLSAETPLAAAPPDAAEDEPVETDEDSSISALDN